MKIRYRLAAIASAVALTSAAGLAGAGAASAAPSPWQWCVTPNDSSCLNTNGSGQPVGVAQRGYSSAFLSFNGEHTNGHEYVEYYVIGSTDCLTDSGAVLYLQPCVQGEARQLWYYDPNSELINDYATQHYGHPDCLTHINGTAGSSIAACNGDQNTQYWDQYPFVP
jgi:hypothetical protein